jgi:hypothetical protein
VVADGSVVNDRLRRLRELDEPALAAALRAHPFVAAALLGVGSLPLGRLNGLSLRTLAETLASPVARYVGIAGLDRIAHQLLSTAVHLGHLPTLEAALVVCPGATAEQLAAARDRLAAALLIEPDIQGDRFVVPAAGVAMDIDRVGVSLVPTIEVLSSDQIAAVLRVLDQDAPQRKADRVAALQVAMRDRVVVRRVVDGLDDHTAAAFDHLVASVAPVPMARLGVHYWFGGSHRSYGAPRTVVDDLMATGLVGVDSGEQTIWVWLDAVVALRGGLFDSWPDAPAVTLGPLAHGLDVLPTVVLQLDRMLDLWAADPVPALKTGGVGVRDVKRTAKEIGTDEHTGALLVALAEEIGLVEPVFVKANRTRTTYSEDYIWRPGAARDEWSKLSAADRWTLLVQRWLASTNDDLALVSSKTAALAYLQDLPSGQGVDGDELAAILHWSHSGLVDVGHVVVAVTELRALGLVPATGRVGLTALGRAVLDGPDAVAAVLPDHDESFVVQADLTLIAPPHLDVMLLARVEQLARLESDAGARLYRLDDVRIARSVEDGGDADEIVAFLRAHSTTPISQNVERFVRDAAAKAGRLRIGAAATYLSADDPLALAQAVSVKAAKLTLVAPTVAVSPLPEGKVLAALRAKGIVLSATAPAVPEGGDAARRPYGRPAAGRSLPALRPVTAPSADRLRELAGALATTR